MTHRARAVVAACAATVACAVATPALANQAPTTQPAPAGADEVSAAIAQLFSSHAQQYQALSAQSALFHQQFVGLLAAGGAAQASTDTCSAGVVDLGPQGPMLGALQTCPPPTEAPRVMRRTAVLLDQTSQDITNRTAQVLAAEDAITRTEQQLAAVALPEAMRATVAKDAAAAQALMRADDVTSRRLQHLEAGLYAAYDGAGWKELLALRAQLRAFVGRPARPAGVRLRAQRRLPVAVLAGQDKAVRIAVRGRVSRAGDVTRLPTQHLRLAARGRAVIRVPLGWAQRGVVTLEIVWPGRATTLHVRLT